LPVIFARRENARRVEDGPVSSRGRGCTGCALRPEVPTCGCGRADLVAAPRPEGSRPAGRGMPPGPRVSAVPGFLRLAPGSVCVRQLALFFGAFAFRLRTRLGPPGLARRGAPLKT
jgi:hypothetical protein